MASTVHLVVGPARCGKTRLLVGRYREAIAGQTSGFGRALWLAPTARAAASVRELLLRTGLNACLEPGITTFESLTRRILGTIPNAPRATSPFQVRVLLRSVIESLKRSQDEIRDSLARISERLEPPGDAFPREAPKLFD